MRRGRATAPGLSGSTERPRGWLEGRGEPAFRARQILDAVWAEPRPAAATLTTCPRAARRGLDEAFRWSTVADETLVLADGGRPRRRSIACPTARRSSRC
jgi:hypothetical protein